MGALIATDLADPSLNLATGHREVEQIPRSDLLRVARLIAAPVLGVTVWIRGDPLGCALARATPDSFGNTSRCAIAAHVLTLVVTPSTGHTDPT
jgi:hypothetical protein